MTDTFPPPPPDEARVGDWMQTYTGRKFWPRDSHPADYSIFDIAHALAMQCRFNGHCVHFYSVAQHSVMVSKLSPPSQQLEGLLHDAAEAYLGDLIRPLKHDGSLLGNEYIRRERTIEFQIAQVFKLDYGYPKSGGWSAWVTRADNIALATEARDIMSSPPADWKLTEQPLGERIVPLAPADAKRLFLQRYYSLLEQRGVSKGRAD